MKTLIIFLSIFLSGNVWAMEPSGAFLTNKGVGEASLRVMRNLNAPNVDLIDAGEVEVKLFSEDCGFAGCLKTYLVFQSFEYNPGANIKSGSVVALVSYNIQNLVDSIEVIAE